MIRRRGKRWLWQILFINGQKISTKAGITVLQAAREAGIDIPHLWPSCAVCGWSLRMCIVEIKGQRALQTSCTFPVTEGMEIQTDSKMVIDARKLVLDMIFQKEIIFVHIVRWAAVASCRISATVIVLITGYFPLIQSFPLDATHKYYLMETQSFVFFVEDAFVPAMSLWPITLWVLGQRGSESMVRADANIPLGESSCISCGTCTQVCPTGALFNKRSAFMGKDSLTTKVKSTCNQCGIGCGTEVVTRGGNVLGVLGDWDASV